MEILLTILLKVGPDLFALLGLTGAYFYVKSKGARQERAKWEKREAEALESLSERLRGAAEKDRKIDDRVTEQIEARKKQIEENTDKFNPGYKFNF
jgi:hypothetical protein